jgi:hydrogenase maturation protein HypF
LQTIELKFSAPQVLACGAELKSNFCLTKGKRAFLSRPIGDLKNMETLDIYECNIEQVRRKYKIIPEVIAHDLHPLYLSTKYALLFKDDRQLIGVQHHHAHIASCMVENGIREKTIGVVFDGTGYGTDGNIWGGEFLTCDYRNFKRMAQLQYIPLPGGDKAIEEPYRVATSYLYQTVGQGFQKLKLDFNRRWDKGKIRVLLQMIDKGINSPLTSSIGRLFDAVSSLIGICDITDYEAQAAIGLQQAAEKAPPGRKRPSSLEYGKVSGYKYRIKKGKDGLIIDPRPMILGIIEDLRKKMAHPAIALKFHNTVADFTLDICKRLREKTGIDRVALSGGVFQNRLLLDKILRRLEENSFTCYVHSKIPTHDGGISLGQAGIAAHKLKGA